MNSIHLIFFAPLLVLLGWASVTDCRSRRIPNWICAALAGTGLVVSFFPQAMVSPMGAVQGFGLGFGLSFLIYLVGGQGAGDVKLLAAVGSWVGPAQILYVFALAAVVSMVIAISYGLAQRRMTELLTSSLLSVWSLVWQRRAPARVGGIIRPLPHAPVIFGATLCVLIYWTTMASGGAL